MNQVMPLDRACKNFEEDLVLYYYGEISGAERERVDQHIFICASCQSFVADLNRVLPPIAEAQKLPETFWDNYYLETVAKLTEHDGRKNWWRQWFVPMRLWMVPAFSTAMIAIVAGALVLGRGNFVSDTAPANIPAEVLADSNQLEFFQSLEILESLNKLEEPDGKKPEAKSSYYLYEPAAKTA